MSWTSYTLVILRVGVERVQIWRVSNPRSGFALPSALVSLLLHRTSPRWPAPRVVLRLTRRVSSNSRGWHPFWHAHSAQPCRRHGSKTRRPGWTISTLKRCCSSMQREIPLLGSWAPFPSTTRRVGCFLIRPSHGRVQRPCCSGPLRSSRWESRSRRRSTVWASS